MKTPPTLEGNNVSSSYSSRQLMEFGESSGYSNQSFHNREQRSVQSSQLPIQQGSKVEDIFNQHSMARTVMKTGGIPPLIPRNQQQLNEASPVARFSGVRPQQTNSGPMSNPGTPELRKPPMRGASVMDQVSYVCGNLLQNTECPYDIRVAMSFIIHDAITCEELRTSQPTYFCSLHKMSKDAFSNHLIDVLTKV